MDPRKLVCIALVAVVLLVVAAAAYAAQPDWKDLSRHLFVLRTLQVFQSTQYVYALGQRIATYDPKSKTFEPWIGFEYRTVYDNRMNLSALDDRLVAQGVDYYEFELASGRLLRRYVALSPDFREWRFHGVTVSETVARRLGTEPGTYGFPYCKNGFYFLCERPTPTFPGWSASFPFPLVDYSVLLRRGIAPDQTGLHVAASFPPAIYPNLSQRFLALDTTRKGLWSWNEYAIPLDLFQRLGFLPFDQSGLMAEQPVRDLTWNSIASRMEERRYIHSFAYLAEGDSLYTNFTNDWTRLFTLLRWPADLGSEEVVEEGRFLDPQNLPNNDAMTGIPDALPDNYIQVVPAIGHGPGARGTYWISDAYMFNPSTTTMRVSVRRVARPESRVEYVMTGHGSLKLADVLRVLGGGPTSDGGDGVTVDALVVDAPYRWGEQLSIYSRTFTTSLDQPGGTYGQAVPAVPSSVGYSNHSSEFLYPADIQSMVSTFILDKREPDRYRHNIGVVNDNDLPLHVRLRFDLASTLPLLPSQPDDQRSFDVAPHSVANVGIESLFPAYIFGERAPRLWIAAERPAPVWLSIVDNLSGDATFVPFSLLTMRSDSEIRMAVPAVANAAGANGTRWQTDLYGLFLPIETTERRQNPRAWFYPAIGTACSSVSEARLTGTIGAAGLPDDVPDYYKSTFADVASQAGCGAVELRGALEVQVASWMSGFTRTYTTRADGGTLGEMLPFYPSGGWPVQHFAGIDVRSGFRINVGLYNGLPYPVNNSLQLYSADGSLVATANLTLAPHQSIQQPLQAFFGPVQNGAYGLSVVPEDRDGEPGRSWAYVSTIDNVTGDPTNWW